MMIRAFFEKHGRKILVALFHACIVLSAIFLAFFFRFDLDMPSQHLDTIRSLILPIVAIKLVVFWRFGLYSGWWRYVSLPDLLNLIKANFFASLFVVVYVAWVHGFSGIPRAVFLLDANLCFLLMSGAMVATRLFRERFAPRPNGGEDDLKQVVVVGAGALGQTIVREIEQCKKLNKTVIGFVDEDAQRQGQSFHGVPVLGMAKDLPTIIKKYYVDLVLITQAAVQSKEIRHIVEVCRGMNIQSKILPAMGDIIDGNVSVDHIRDVQLEDLLGPTSAENGFLLPEPVAVSAVRCAGRLQGSIPSLFFSSKMLKPLCFTSKGSSKGKTLILKLSRA